MADYAVMPLADYQDACEAVREKTGSTAAITSGELAGQIRGIEFTTVYIGAAEPDSSVGADGDIYIVRSVSA